MNYDTTAENQDAPFFCWVPDSNRVTERTERLERALTRAVYSEDGTIDTPVADYVGEVNG